MSDVANPVLAVARLRETLEETADALAHPDLERLLSCEARIEAALMQLPASGLSASARSIVLAEVELARTALIRCRRLGQALDQFVRLGMAAQGFSSGYGSDAGSLGANLHSLNTTV